MAAVLTEIVVDARDPATLARWWAEVLGWVVTDEEEGYSWISATGGFAERPYIVFIPVGEDKTVKNRVHIDVSPFETDKAQELERLFDMGATKVDVGQAEDVPWVVLADPEGNEFCLLSRRVDA
jgi:predicted enzyme related to lactoylglutathione lyase